MKLKIAVIIAVSILTLLTSGCTVAPADAGGRISQNTTPSAAESAPLQDGLLTEGSLITVAGIEIKYEDKDFELTNTTDELVRVQGSIVGMKSDGGYEYLTSLSLSWPDEIAYAEDLKENGWAVKSNTNLLRPGESARAEILPFGLYVGSGSDSFLDPDVDGDGLYDIIFTVSPQVDADTLTFSTSDPVSDVYKIPVADVE